ncbi:MAG: cyclopropane fatty acyl phospholipid synthase [Candidatus Berkelbacteria bacterium]|nr:MAG: cyclopropane fatty acyl phospholipid synthase [Candidatus Berkelbacteria bacterium]QQG51815.1 MAG: cyclopropane fatty acyl phospholipid synthase [Candidatus Berkelbacteria bacterium]
MLIEKLLAQADIRLDGKRAWDLKVNDQQAFQRTIFGGILGIGESYMDGQWDCQSIDQLVYRAYKANLAKSLYKHPTWLIHAGLGYLLNTGSRWYAKRLAKEHYDLGNDLFQAMLDHRLVYTCGYWRGVKSLNEAQEQKLDLICQKLKLKPKMRVLDIGGGWGSFAKYAARKYGVSVVNITVSKEQVKLANELCEGLPVENRLADYRDVNEKFDAVVSIEMFEAVGWKNYRHYMDVVHRCLPEGGLFVFQTIGGNFSTTHTNPWIDKYIFPGGMLPSLEQLDRATQGLFIEEGLENFGTDYDKTLMAWWDNFDRNWPKLKSKYGGRFYRMWKLYLQGCAGSFRARNLQLWQITYSKAK